MTAYDYIRGMPLHVATVFQRCCRVYFVSNCHHLFVVLPCSSRPPHVVEYCVMSDGLHRIRSSVCCDPGYVDVLLLLLSCREKVMQLVFENTNHSLSSHAHCV